MTNETEYSYANPVVEWNVAKACKWCKHWSDLETCEMLIVEKRSLIEAAWGVGYHPITKSDFYCKYFEPRIDNAP